MLDKILIATDGSVYSRRAVDYGIGMAKKMGAPVIALYVINMKSLEIYAFGHHDDITGYEDMARALQFDGDKAIEYVLTAGKSAGVDVSIKIVRGFPSDEILKLASEERVSLIIVGNLGKTGLEHLLLGSVSEAVVKKASCPVLVVRGNV